MPGGSSAIVRANRQNSETSGCKGELAWSALAQIHLSTQPDLCFYSPTAWTIHVCPVYVRAIMPPGACVQSCS